MLVPAYRPDRMPRPDRRRQRIQPRILRVRIRQRVRAFQFDPDGKVVAALAAFKGRHPRMPRPQNRRHELYDRPVPADQEMGGDPHVADVLEPGVGRDVQAVLEEIDDGVAREHAGRQADVVDYQQAGVFVVGSRVVIGGGAAQDSTALGQPAIRPDGQGPLRRGRGRRPRRHLFPQAQPGVFRAAPGLALALVGLGPGQVDAAVGAADHGFGRGLGVVGLAPRGGLAGMGLLVAQDAGDEQDGQDDDRPEQEFTQECLVAG